MRRLPILALVACLAFLALASVPGGTSSVASASHALQLRCGSTGDHVDDGVITPNEYSESYFDPATKTLAYFLCEDASPSRWMHVAIVTPWADVMDFRFQAKDDWDGTFNVVRTLTAPTRGFVDGYIAAPGDPFVADVDDGGTDDVRDTAIGLRGETFVYEFSMPLASADPFDSRLSGTGPYFFGFAEFRSHGEEGADFTLVHDSGLLMMEIQEGTGEGVWTSLELSLPPEIGPSEELHILFVLRDETGKPIAGRTVDVFVSTTFGFLNLGGIRTNAQGVGHVEYVPLDAGSYLLGVGHRGGGGYHASVAWQVLEVVPPPATDTSLLHINPVGFIVPILGGIWATYVYIVFILGKSLREGREEEADEARPPASEAPAPEGEVG